MLGPLEYIVIGFAANTFDGSNARDRHGPAQAAGDLHAAGVLTNEEFAAAKAKILG
jgi:hypothetical protein